MIISVNDSLIIKRVDKFLTQMIPGLSRSEARRLIFSEAVRIEGKPVKKGLFLKAGDRIELPDSVLQSPRDIIPDFELNIEILHEDEAFIVVNKKAGVACHPIRVQERNTLANALIAKYPYLKGVGFSFLQPGLVNRIDTKTSGIILVAKNNEVFRQVRTIFKSNLVKKGYLALVHGNMSVEGEINLCIAGNSGKKTKVKVLNEQQGAKQGLFKARRALTHVRILKQLASFTLLEIELITGVRHQIRAHLSFLGHPVVGDTLYGSKESWATEEGERYFLHAHYLGLPHPIRGEWVQFHSPLPRDLDEYLASLSP